MAECGHQMRGFDVPVTGLPDRLAVHGNHRLPVDCSPAQPQPRVTHPAGQPGIKGFDDTADRGFARHTIGHVQPAKGIGADVGGPFGDRGQRTGAGSNRTHGQDQHGGQGVASSPPVTGIRHLVSRVVSA